MSEETSYHRGDKFIRVIRLFDELLTTERGVTTRQLADRLETNVRTVQRYIDQCRQAGIDIEEDDQHRYRIGKDTRLPPLQFSKAEGVTVLIALRLLQQMRSRRDDALIGAVARLAAAMSIPSVTAYLGTMREDVEERPEGDAAQQIENTVVRCFVDRVPCEIEYANAEGEVSKRVVRTYFLEPLPESRTIYVYGLDGRSKTMRWFRMDRIQHARAVPVEGTYTVPEDFDIAEVTRSAWGIWQAGAELQEVVLRFCPEIVPRVRQSTWHPSAVLTELPDGGVEMWLRVANEIEMRPWVLGFGSLVEVVEPPSLRDHVAESMREGARMYDRQVSSG